MAWPIRLAAFSMSDEPRLELFQVRVSTRAFLAFSIASRMRSCSSG